MADKKGGISDGRPKSCAERQRRFRERCRRGITLAMVEVTPEVLENFLSRGWLTETEAEDPVKIGAVIRAIIEGREPMTRECRGIRHEPLA